MRNKLATVISHLSDPVLTFPFLLAALLFKSGLTSNQVKILLPTLFIIDLVIPGVFFLWALKERWVSDWEMSRREERLTPYGVVLVCWFTGLILLQRWGNDFLLDMGLIFYLVAFLGSLVTVFWKVSVHVAANTVFVLVLNFLFDWKIPWLYLIVPVVAWARWQRKKHTVGQLIGGFLLSMIVVLGGFTIFGFF